MVIGIIGGGPSGIIALYECKRRNLRATLYEKQCNYGGVWNLKSSQPRAHHSTLFNSSYFVSTFDLDNNVENNAALPDNDYLTSSEFYDYLKNLISSCNLMDNIILNQNVLSINTIKNEFRINVYDMVNKREMTYLHDYVMICTGRNGAPVIPNEPFLSGELVVDNRSIWHASSWDPLQESSPSSEIIKRKRCRILVVGGSHSAAESIQDAIASADLNGSLEDLKIFWAPTRKPDTRKTWMIDRYPHKGKKAALPLDQTPCRLYDLIPSWLSSRQIRKMVTPLIHCQSNEVPNFHKDLFCICNVLLIKNAIENETIEILNKSVLRIYKDASNNILFDTLDNSGLAVDAVVLATGYGYAEPLVNNQFILFKSKFYRSIIPLDASLRGRLSFMGASKLIGSNVALLQMEVRWLLYNWFSADSNWESRLKYLQSDEGSHHSQATLTNVHRLPANVLDQLAADMGVMPRLWTHLLSLRPRARHVSLACILTSVSIYQYEDLTEDESEKLEREKYLLKFAEACFKKANCNFKLICFLSDAFYYSAAAMIIYGFCRCVKRDI